MADYRSSVDERNDNQLGFGNTIDQVNKLKQFIEQKRQFQQQQDQPFALANQKAQLGQEEQDRNLQNLKEMMGSVKPGERKSFKIGDVSGTTGEDDPLKYLYRRQDQNTAKMGEEARKAQAHIDQQLKAGKESVESSKSSLDALDLGTEEGDTAAIINEGKALGGARAAAAFAAKLDPGKTIPGLAQNIANVLSGQGTSKLTPDLRNNLREMAFTRAQSVQKSYQTAKQGLGAQIDVASPITKQYGDPKALKDSAFQPYDAMFDDINSRHKQYMDQKVQAINQQKQTMQNPQQPYSQGQGVLSQIGGAISGGLGALFGHKNQATAAPAEQTVPQAQSPADPGQARYQELLRKQQQGN